MITDKFSEKTDIDIEVFHLKADQLIDILAKFGEVKQVGKIYPVIKIKGYPYWDFTIAESDDYKKAALRRDFTINTVMMDITTGEIWDYLGGREDINNKVIRHVNAEVFAKDPLRAYRAATLAARLGFNIHPETLELMKDTDVSSIPPERIYEELKKLLLLSPKPSIGLRYLEKSNILKKNHPDLYRLIDCRQEPKNHPEGDVWEHTLLVVDGAAKLKNQSQDPLALMWAALLHDIGKPDTTKKREGKITSYGHDVAGEKLAIRFLENLRSSKSLTAKVATLVKEHMHPVLLYRQKERVSDKAIRKLVNRVDLMELLLLSEADYLGRGKVRDYTPIREWYLKRVEELGLDPRKKIEPLVRGKDLVELGIKPDKKFREILDYAFELQLEGVEKEEIMREIERCTGDGSFCMY
ncbi:MAG: HD domain-containing protein [Syntrophomonadaceae bacterium]|nr:HD domain-containing protein [Syntrophomonadaceae bacterium]